MHFKKNLIALTALCPLLFMPGMTLKAQLSAGKDSIIVAVAPEYNQVGAFHRFWLGESYRKIWATPVKMRIIDLQKEKGGLKIVKLGGGMQTRSLRLVDPTGKEWALRTVQKYPERGLAPNLRETIAKDIAQDQVSTNHPFAALVVPTLAGALDLPHAKPEIVYVGDDPGLGEYRKDFANAVYLIEERSPFEEKTDNTEKAQKKIQKNNDTDVDQQLTLRARLLDFLLGDWDRHEDNWRWLADKDTSSGNTTYMPIPRDRDKVFYKTSGVFPWVLTHQWLKTHLQPYSEDIRDVEHWSFNERYFDRYFLNELNEKDWKKEIKYVQEKMTDALIQKAFSEMPAPVYQLTGQELIKNFTSRRDKLDSLAMKYYRFLSIYVDVPASAKKEYFEVKNEDDGTVKLSVYNIKKDGSNGRVIYKRKFDPEVTKEIRLFGLEGNNVFDVQGSGKSKIAVRLIGGDEPDQYKIGTEVRNKPFIYDRADLQNELPEKGTVKLRLGKDSTATKFDKNSFLYDRTGVLVNGGYNVDQGVQLGLGYVIEKQGFRKDPYASKHELWVNYSTGRKSFIIDYAGDFKKAIGNSDLKLNLHLLGPNNLSNFFGLGNNTAFDREDDSRELRGRDDDMGYYRNRYDYLTGELKLSRPVTKHLRIEGGFAGSYYISGRKANDEKLLADFDVEHPEERVFGDRVYAGLTAGWVYDTRNNVGIPTKGVYWKTTFLAQHQLNESDKYGSVTTEFRFYINPGQSGLVIADRIGAGTTIGDPAFYQRMQIGGVNSLRGFNSRRFTGNTMFYNNLDLRLKLFNFTSYLVPGTVGMIGFTDVGRVWEKGERSGRWHQGYGGGLYVMPGEVILVQGSVGFSKEASMLYLSIGFNF